MWTALLLVWASGSSLGSDQSELVPGSRTPVILVPGTTGVELVDATSGKFVWGKGSNLMFPHDGGFATALPLALRAPVSRPLETGEVIEEIRLAGLIHKPIYGPLVDLLVDNGYRRGDLANPQPRDSFFLFAYDWRQDNVVSAALLLERLEALRRLHGRSRQSVVLVCQSSGAHICRYLAKYGGASLAEAEDGRAVRPASIEVEKLILVGSSNGGSLRILRELDRGRRYIPLVGRKWQPETLFTFRSLFQDLPANRTDLFVNERGERMDVDLYDSAAWQEFGWSVFAELTVRRVKRRSGAERLGSTEERLEYLQRMLADARRFQLLLSTDARGFGEPDYYLIGNTGIDTPERAVLLEENGDWKILFTGDGWLESRARLRELVTTSGDGHASVASQRWLSPQEKARLAAEPFEAEGGHFEQILDPAALDYLLEILTHGD